MVDILLSILTWLGAFGNFILAIIVLIRNPRNALNKSFSFMAIFLGLWGISLYFFEHPFFFTSRIWLIIVYNVVIIATGAFFLFSYYFPQKLQVKNILPPLAFVFGGAIPLIYTLIATKLFVNNVVLENWGRRQILGPAFPFFGAWTTISSIWFFVNFYRNYKNGNNLAKLQLKYLAVGAMLLVTMPLALDIFLPILFKNSQYIWFSSISTVFLNGFVAYTILKHRLFDIRLVVARSVSYLLLLALLGIIYASGLFLMGSFIIKVPSSNASIITSTILALIIAFTFQPLSRFLEKFTNKIFYKDHYDTDEILGSLSSAVIRNLSLSSVSYEALDILTQGMHVTKAAFVLMVEKKLYVVESKHNLPHLEITKNDFEKLKKEDKMLIFDELEEGSLKSFLRKKGISICLPLQTKKHFVGFLILSEKSSGDIYFDQDIELLEIASPQFSVALENAQRFEEISLFNVTLQEKVKKATKELEVANKRLKDLDKLKDDFISIAGHELRTPAAAVKNYLWMLLNKPDHAKAEMLKKAYEANERTISLINDTLDVSKIEAGRIDVNPANFNLSELADNVVEELTPKASERKIKLSKVGEKGLMVYADKERIHQVLSNLVTNAIKFTQQGAVTITLTKKGNTIETAVSDTGVGIKKENLEKLFTKFGRLDTSYSATAQTSGTGLGLYISKGLIELSGGKIWVSSEFGKGSVFTFSLPVAKGTNIGKNSIHG